MEISPLIKKSLCILTVLLTSCFQTKGEADRDILHKNLVTAIAQGTQDLLTQMIQISESQIKVFEQENSCEDLTALKENWKELSITMASFEPYILSPFMDLESKIHSWPVRDHLIASQFGDSTHNIYESAPLGKGIWALERLLYSHNMNEKSTCELYKAQLSEIHRLLNIYHRLWNDQYSQELQIAQGSLWMNPQDVIDDLTLASISVLEIVHKSKLDKPIRGNGIAAWPESLQAWRSQTSFELIQANLKSLEKIWDHHNPLWKIIEDGLEGQIHDQFDHIHQLEKELSTQSLYLELLDNQRQNYEEYINSVYTLLVLFSVDLSSQLGVVNVLSDNDGD